MEKPSREELLHLADQEQHERGLLPSDNYGEQRASIVREWALREAAGTLKIFDEVANEERQ